MDYVMGEVLEAPASTGTAAPKTRMPAGATDCHMHVFDARFPFVPERNPGLGTARDYQLFQRRLGLSRCVVVAPSSYGLDNSCLLDALALYGTDKARGVASIDADTPTEELQRLHDAGCRGIRLNVGRVAGAGPEDIRVLADKIAPLNWHLQLHMHPPLLLEHAASLQDLPVTLVIDHMGRTPQPGGRDHPVVEVLDRLLAKGNTYTKISFFYDAPYDAYGPLARHFIQTAPERVVWGADWPHGNKVVKPDDVEALDHLIDWAGDEATLRRILTDNPTALYWRD